jgi:hypothetical protein
MRNFKFLVGKSSPKFWRTHQGSAIHLFELERVHIFRILLCLQNRGNMRIPDIYDGYTRQEWIQIMQDELERRIQEYERIQIF